MPDFASLDAAYIDAWTGDAAASAPMTDFRFSWALGNAVLPTGQALLPPVEARPEDWQHPDIGWGLILPDVDGLSPRERSTAAGAPEPIQALLASRPVSKVLRYRKPKPGGAQLLTDYDADSDIPIATATHGVAPGALPDYLLIVGSPEDIPWTVQFQLNLTRKVGRLDLDDASLSNYVNALINGWPDGDTNFAAPVIWAVNQGDVITPLMRDAIAERLHDTFLHDPDGDLDEAVFIDGSAVTATSQMLKDALKGHHPRVILTTSHGQTGPLDKPTLMRSKLGFLVDGQHQTVEPSDLLADWQPSGAIWFAQACCSAGARKPSIYQGIFDANSDVGRVLDGVAAVGPMTAPFPNALLGASRPLRAFIGHVEPTFDWTMRFPLTKGRLTQWVRSLMYNGICSGKPVGLALEQSRLYEPVGSLLLEHADAVGRHAEAARSARQRELTAALYNKVTAYDRASTVLLGDPTVAIPVPTRDGV